MGHKAGSGLNKWGVPRPLVHNHCYFIITLLILDVFRSSSIYTCAA